MVGMYVFMLLLCWEHALLSLIMVASMFVMHEDKCSFCICPLLIYSYFFHCKIDLRSIKIMASAEAKPAWQRSAANHFSCSTSSSSSSRLESDNTPDNDVKGPHDKCAGFLPFNPNYDVLSDRKWWLNLQPNPGQYKDIMSEQLSTLEAEVLEVLSYEFISKTANSCEDQSKEEFSAKAGNSFEESLWDVIATSMKNDQDTVLQELKAETHNDPQKNSTKKDATDFWYSADHYMNMDSLNCLASQQPRKLSSDMGSQWLGTEKTEPWWRTAGKDDLASLVAQKSLEHIENCDLPRPQGKNYRNSTFAGPESVDQDEILASSLDRMAQTQFSNHDFCTQRSHFSSSPAHDSGLPFRYGYRIFFTLVVPFHVFHAFILLLLNRNSNIRKLYDVKFYKDQ